MKRLVPLLMVTATVCAAPAVQAVAENGDVRAAEARPAGVVPATSAIERDPFRPFTLDLRQEPRAPLSPLQRYELRQLTLAATIWNASPPRAMVQDSSGMGYIVGIGTPMGSNGGFVTAIERERLIVEERVVDYYGKEIVNRVVMETPKEDGPKSARERQ